MTYVNDAIVRAYLAYSNAQREHTPRMGSSRLVALISDRDADTVAYRATQAALSAFLDVDHITDIITARWQQFVTDGDELAPEAFAREFAQDIRSVLLGERPIRTHRAQEERP